MYLNWVSSLNLYAFSPSEVRLVPHPSYLRTAWGGGKSLVSNLPFLRSHGWPKLLWGSLDTTKSLHLQKQFTMEGFKRGPSPVIPWIVENTNYDLNPISKQFGALYKEYIEEGYNNLFALSRVLSLDFMSSHLKLIGPPIQTLILYADWSKITIIGLQRVARHCVTLCEFKMLLFT